jgi:hypothetical protein
MSNPELNPQVPGEEPTTEAAEPAKAAKPSKSDGLPDQSSVNQNKIPRAVLTKQGWVVPTAKPKA